MTASQRKKLAKAARELAYEFAEGRGPELVVWSWCGCAAAQVVQRAGIPNVVSEASEWRMPAAVLDVDFLDGILTDATDEQCIRREPGAVVFPLLWAADELETRR